MIQCLNPDDLHSGFKKHWKFIINIVLKIVRITYFDTILFYKLITYYEMNGYTTGNSHT